MPSICFLTAADPAKAALPARNDNAVRLPEAFRQADWRVHISDHQALRLAGNRVVLSEAPRQGPGNATAPQANHRLEIPPDEFDLIWMLGFGQRESLLDRTQLLLGMDPARFVNSPAAMLHLHAKYHLPLSSLAAHHPETYASSDPAWLTGIVEQGGDWIVKPPAGSFGRSVFRVSRHDRNLHVIIEQLTGHDDSRFCVLQRYVPEIEGGEKRVLMANGRILGAYLRTPGSDHRVNLTGQGRAALTTLTAAERDLAERAGTVLAAQGVRFAAVDMAYPWLIEFNLANPGGLETIERLSGEDLTTGVVTALAELVRR